MGVVIISQFCKDCGKVTRHIHGESVSGKRFIECEECGRGK
jgi:hypothetical protein